MAHLSPCKCHCGKRMVSCLARQNDPETGQTWRTYHQCEDCGTMHWASACPIRTQTPDPDEYLRYVNMFIDFYQRFKMAYNETYARIWIASRPFHIGGACSDARDAALRTVQEWTRRIAQRAAK